MFVRGKYVQFTHTIPLIQSILCSEYERRGVGYIPKKKVLALLSLVQEKGITEGPDVKLMRKSALFSVSFFIYI